MQRSNPGTGRDTGGMGPESDHDETLIEAFLQPLAAKGAESRVCVLTGAGVSAESGIPTFRGPDGYWTVGSKNYRGEQIATIDMFKREPEACWAWYLHRIAVCRSAKPNDAHRALAHLAERIGDRLALVTQNVDGLHGRAGSPRAHTFPIHGEIMRTRIVDDPGEPTPLDAHLFAGDSPAVRAVEAGERRQKLEASELERLRLADGRWRRPHVLFFDEYYDERLFRSDTAMRRAAASDVLLVIGTSGATTLPAVIVSEALERRHPVLVVGPEETVFSEEAEKFGLGGLLIGSACERVPSLVDRIADLVE